jgi:tetratricopeptide (TPR) repeat protein
LARDGKWEQSEKSFRRALEIDPNTSTIRLDYVNTLLLPLGRIDEAIGQMRLAEKADPLSPAVHNDFGYVLLSAGRYDEAVTHCAKARDISGPPEVECLGRVRIGQGRFDEAVQILAAAPNPRYYGHALGRAGRREEAEKLTTTRARNPFQQALIFAGMGDKDRTFEALDRMTVQGPVRIGRTLTYPEFNLLRGDPRLKALRKKVGLPE